MFLVCAFYFFLIGLLDYYFWCSERRFLPCLFNNNYPILQSPIRSWPSCWTPCWSLAPNSQTVWPSLRDWLRWHARYDSLTCMLVLCLGKRALSCLTCYSPTFSYIYTAPLYTHWQLYIHLSWGTLQTLCHLTISCLLPTAPVRYVLWSEKQVPSAAGLPRDCGQALDQRQWSHSRNISDSFERRSECHQRLLCWSGSTS